LKVLVLGGTGWVGHHIALAFFDAGYDVTICSRGQKTTFADELPEGLKRVQADKQDPAGMAKVFETAYEVVIDSVPTEASIDLVVKYARGLKRYLHCSSTGGYAPLPFVPGDETMPYDQFMGGWKAKGVVDRKIMDLHKTQGFPATSLRPCYITGPGMLPLDNLGGRREDFIPDILAGKTLELPNDGQALLQPVHVLDLAQAFLLASEAPAAVGQIYNICLEKALTLTRYLQITAAALGREAKIACVPVAELAAKYEGRISRTGLYFLATHMCFDIRKAREQLGYTPHCTTEEAITETALWAADKLGHATDGR